MPLKPGLLKKLALLYPPNSMVELRFKGLDASVRIDADGRPWQLFLGRRDKDGHIRGERYVRVYKQSPDGTVIKDHWDLKGKAS